MSSIPGPRTPAATWRALNAFRHSVPAGLSYLNDEYGEICSLGMGPSRWIFMFGPEANEIIFSSPDRFQFGGGYEILRPIAGSTALVLSDGADHKRRRTAVQASFSRNSIDRYVAHMLRRVDTMMDSWKPGQRVDIYEEMRGMVRGATIEVFGGKSLAGRLDYISGQLDLVHASLNHSLLRSLLTWNLPHLAGRRGRKAKAALAAVDSLVFAEITRRRQARDYGQDLISAMLCAEDGDHAPFSDAEIRDMLVSLFIASYDPVSSALGWAAYSMLSDKAVWSGVRDEVFAVDGSGTGSRGGVRQLGYLGRVVSETLRLYPAVVASPRLATVPFEFAGHRIAAGSHVLVSQYTTHHSSTIWPEAERFDPDRWDRTRDDYRAPTPYEYLPFGSGPRRCLGGGLALACVPAILARVVQRVSLQLESKDVQLGGIAALIPRGGLWVRVLSVAPASSAEVPLTVTST